MEYQAELYKQLNPPYIPYADIEEWNLIIPRVPSQYNTVLVPGNVYYVFKNNPMIARGVITSIIVKPNAGQNLSANTLYQANVYLTLVNIWGIKLVDRVPIMSLLQGTYPGAGPFLPYSIKLTPTFWLPNVDLGKSYIECVRAYSATGENPALPTPGMFYMYIGYRDNYNVK